MSGRQQGSFHPGRSLVTVNNVWRWWLICFLILGLSGCVRHSVEKSHWESLEGPKGSFVVALAKDPVNPRRLYAGLLNGGVMTSTDGGSNWHHLLDSQLQPRSDSTGSGEPDLALDVQSICTPNDGQIFVATLGQGVNVRAPDGTWRGLRRGLGVTLAATEVVVGGQDEEFLYAGTQEGIYALSRPVHRSDRWERLDPWQGSPAELIQTLFASRETVPRLYAGTRGGFFHSTDGGETWQRATRGIDREIPVVAMAVDTEDLDHLVVSSWEKNEKRIYRSTDGGETWVASQQNFDSVVEVLVFSTVTSGRIYAATYRGRLYASQDGGLSWEPEGQVGAPVLSLLQADEGQLVAGTDGQGIFVRDTNGKWASAQIDSPLLTVQAILPMGDELYAGTACCGVFRRTSGGEWQNFSQGLPLQARSISSLQVNDNEETIYAGTYGDGVYARTQDSGRWQALRDGLPRSAWQVRSLRQFRFGSERVLLAGTDDGLYKLRKQRWEHVSSQELRQEVDNVLWEPSTKILFATATGGRLYSSRDGGKSWSPDEGAPTRIKHLALASSAALQRLILGSARWTLFAQTEVNELYYRASDDMGWQQVEIERKPEEQIAIWSYPHQPRGFLLVRMTLDDEHIFQRIPPPSFVTLVLQQAEWEEDILPVEAGISVAVTDPHDKEILYVGTANRGVYQARITLPTLWQQIPTDSPIKVALPPVVSVIAFLILSYALLRFLLRPPKPIELEVQVRAAAETGKYQVHVEGPEQRSDDAIVSLPGSLLELKEAKNKLFAGSPSVEEIHATGSALFDFIFGESALQHIYAGSKEVAKRTTLRLRIEAEDELVELPWEVLRDPHISQLLALTEDYSVTRRTRSAVPLPQWKASRHISVLMATASPQEYPIPMIEKEIMVLKEVLGSLRQVDIDVIEHATPEDLLDRLQREDYQILHFAGHADKSGLILEDAEGHHTRLDIQDLAAAISKPQLHMIFLNACETAGGVSQSGIPSLASMLAEKGIPLVLAMQHEIPNMDALVFVRTFYEELVVTGSVDVSLSRARQAVFGARKSVTPPTWAIPVLLIRGSNSDLLRPLPRWQQRLGLHRRRTQAGEQ